MIRAALYLRSSKDRSDVSIDAQRRELQALAARRGFAVVAEFSDAVERADDWSRPGFARMLKALHDKDRAWSVLLVLDTSRLARDNELLGATVRHECKKHGVAIEYAKFPSINPMTDVMVQSVDQLFARVHSMMSREKGLAGMAENVRRGWRAGGRAPRGYRLHHEPTGAIRDGQPVLKSRLVPGDDALQVRAYLEHRSRGLKRARALELAGVRWPATSLLEMERNAMVYAGHTVWNRSAERTEEGYVGGGKWRPRDEWLIQRDTHDALISDAAAEAIMDQVERKKRSGGMPARRTYLLSGLLVAPDGQPWNGDAGYYRLGKGARILAESVDRAVVASVLEALQAEPMASRIAEHYLALAKAGDATPDATAAMKRRLGELDKKIGRLTDLLSQTRTPEALLRQIETLEDERTRLLVELEGIESVRETARALRDITAADVRRLLRGLADDMNAAAPEILRDELRTAVERVELSPDSFEAEILLRFGPASKSGELLASPQGTERFPAYRSAIKALITHNRRQQA